MPMKSSLLRLQVPRGSARRPQLGHKHRHNRVGTERTPVFRAASGSLLALTRSTATTSDHAHQRFLLTGYQHNGPTRASCRGATAWTCDVERTEETLSEPPTGDHRKASKDKTATGLRKRCHFRYLSTFAAPKLQPLQGPEAGMVPPPDTIRSHRNSCSARASG